MSSQPKMEIIRPKYVSATRRQERGKDPGLGSGSPTRRHLYGYSVLIAGAACYGVGVLSSAWHETPSVTAGLAAGTRRVGAWWGCDAVEDKPELTRCHVVQITRPASVLQVVFLVLTGVSVLLYLVSMVVSSKLVCRPRSTSMIFRWSIVARASLLAGITGIMCTLTFAMIQTTDGYIYGFYFAVVGSFLGVVSGFLFARVRTSRTRSKVGSRLIPQTKRQDFLLTRKHDRFRGIQ